MKNKIIISILGNILMIISFIYIIKNILSYNIQISNLISLKVIIIVIISIIVYAVVVIMYSKSYFLLLRKLNENEHINNKSIAIYCKTNLFKYLPGNIFHYLGRNELAYINEINYSKINTSTIIEMLLLFVASLITSITFAGRHFAYNILDINYLNILLGFTIISSILVVLFKTNTKIRINIIKYITLIKMITPIDFFKLGFTYTITFIINSILFIIILYFIGGIINSNYILPIIGMHTFSWMAGFLTPGVPAGLGVREAIMSSFLFGIIDKKLVISAVLLYRIVTILGDVLGFVIAKILYDPK